MECSYAHLFECDAFSEGTKDNTGCSFISHSRIYFTLLTRLGTLQVTVSISDYNKNRCLD